MDHQTGKKVAEHSFGGSGGSTAAYYTVKVSKDLFPEFFEKSTHLEPLIFILLTGVLAALNGWFWARRGVKIATKNGLPGDNKSV